MYETIRSKVAAATRALHEGRLEPAMAALQRRLLDDPTGEAGVETAEPGRFLARSYAGAAGSREYKLYIPTGYRGEPAPLIVMLHGCTQTADDFAAGTGMNALAETRGALVAYPVQSATANRAKCWNWFERRDQQRDRGEPSIIVGIVRQIARDYAVDSHRIYVAGLSAGGAAAAVLATLYPELFAAAGIHSGIACGLAHDVPSAFAAMRGTAAGVQPLRDRTTRNARSRTPTIVFHGDRDTTVHRANGERIVAATIDPALHVTSEKRSVPGGRGYTRTSYTDDAGHVLAECWIVHGAGHAWSGGRRTGSYTDPKGPDASAEMLRFFLMNRRR